MRDAPTLIDIPALGRRDIAALPLSELYVPFESLGSNSEFGIVQRDNGYDVPGLFRYVGFPSADAMIAAIDRGLAGMFDEQQFDFAVPDGWPDWQLNCKVYGIGFRTAIPSSLRRDSSEWTKRTTKMITLFRFMKRNFLTELRTREKIYIFRDTLDSSGETADRLYAALRKHGEAWLLYVAQDPEKPSGWLEMRKPGLIVAAITRLSNETTPIVDFGAWERIAREALALRGQVNSGSQAAETSDDIFIVPPEPHLEVIKHSVAAGATVDKPIFHIYVNGLKTRQLYSFEVCVYVPSSFEGTHISLVMWGAATEDYNIVSLTLRDVWQRLFVTGWPSGDEGELAPSLLADSQKGTAFYSSGWRLTAVDELKGIEQQSDSNVSGGEVLGYYHNNGGLNNQKGALGGLVTAAFVTKRPIFIPDMFNLDHFNDCCGPVAFGKIYDENLFRKFARDYGIRIVNRPANFVTDDPFGWVFFQGDPKFKTPSKFGIDFGKCLIPLILNTDTFKNLAEAVFDQRNVKLTLQLRIEKDWAIHAEATLKETIEDGEDYYIPYQAIFAKIDKTLRHLSQTIYVVCDENGLPVSKEEIRTAVKSEFGFDLLWKSDFLGQPDGISLSALELSLIDFEMSVRSDYFVGLTRSTFSNSVCWEKYCRAGIKVETHYIYNTREPVLARRLDNGVHPEPENATRRNR